MLGSGMLLPAPSALADVLTLLRLMDDPAAFQDNLKAMGEAIAALDVKLADIEAREKKLDEAQIALDAGNKKLAADRAEYETEHQSSVNSLEAAVGFMQNRDAELDERHATLNERQTQLDAADVAHANRAAELDARAVEQTRMQVEIDQREADLKAREDAAAKEMADWKERLAGVQRLVG